MEAVVLHRVGFLEYFCPKQGQDFKPSAAPLYPNMGQVPPPPPPSRAAVMVNAILKLDNGCYLAGISAKLIGQSHWG